MPKHPSKPVYSEKTPKNRFEDMELTAGGSYGMSNSWRFQGKLNIYCGVSPVEYLQRHFRSDPIFFSGTNH